MTYPPIQPQQNPELYRPEGMPEFKVGMRVRVRVSAECPCDCAFCGHERIHKELSGSGYLINRPWLTSCEFCGHVETSTIFAERTGHLYSVKLDNDPTEVRPFAASELIPLAPDEQEKPQCLALNS